MWLGQYETAVDEMLGKIGGEGGQLSGPDQERERVYGAAGKLSSTLEGYNNDLTDIINQINTISGQLNRGGKGDDPVSFFSQSIPSCQSSSDNILTFIPQLEQVVRILNQHLQQLQMIDVGAEALHQRVQTAQAEQRSAYSRTGARGLNGSSAADDFYKSFMSSRR